MLSSVSNSDATPNFTDLHLAASEGDVRKIKRILRSAQDSVYDIDESGLTPLHYAALNGHFEAVKALTPNGEAIFTLDNIGTLPITYVNSDEHPEIIAYLLEKGSYPACTTDIHMAAAMGDVDELKRILTANPEKLEEIDAEGRTPLHFAVSGNQRRAAEFLVRAGANVDVMDSFQLDLVSSAKDLPILGYVKKICSLSPIFLENLRGQFRRILEKESEIAKEQNKQLLIMIGETHYLYKVLQIEEMMLKEAKRAGVHSLLAEFRPQEDEFYPTDALAKELGMKVVAIDHPSIEATMEQRNAHMSHAIFSANRSAMVRIGSEHLQGILEMPDVSQLSSEFHKRFHVVPFNLSSILKNLEPSSEALFAMSQQHAIQVLQDGFSSPDAAIKRWNASHPSGFLGAAFDLFSQYTPSFSALFGTAQPAALPSQQDMKVKHTLESDVESKEMSQLTAPKRFKKETDCKK